MYKVYQIKFSNDLIYIGRTKNSLQDRLIQHLNCNVNPNMAYCFSQKDLTYKIEELISFDTEQESKDFEKRLILKLHKQDHESILNLFAGGTRLEPNIKFNTRYSGYVPKTFFKKKKYNKEPQRGKTFRCSKCKVYKPGTEFFSDRSRFNGLHSRCKECALKVNRKYRQENREKIRDRQNKYRQENREKVNELQRKYYQENREKIDAMRKKYYQENREKINAMRKKYYQENREDILKKQKEYQAKYKDKRNAQKRKSYHRNKNNEAANNQIR